MQSRCCDAIKLFQRDGKHLCATSIEFAETFHEPRRCPVWSSLISLLLEVAYLMACFRRFCTEVKNEVYELTIEERRRGKFLRCRHSPRNGTKVLYGLKSFHAVASVVSRDRL